MQFHPELILIPERPNLRVRSKDLDFLFSNITEDTFVDIFNKSIVFVRNHFDEKDILTANKNIDKETYFHLTKEIALHWIYYYNINNFPIELTPDDLIHPQTNQIVMRLSEKLTKDKDLSHSIASSILKMPLKKYEQWLEGYLRWVEMW